MKNFWVYILTNPSKTVLYIGMTNNLVRRLAEHKAGRGQYRHFTGKYYCYNLVWYEQCYGAQNAISREKQLKRWSRSKKEQLIRMKNPEWRFLNDPVNGYA